MTMRVKEDLPAQFQFFVERCVGDIWQQLTARFCWWLQDPVLVAEVHKESDV